MPMRRRALLVLLLAVQPVSPLHAQDAATPIVEPIINGIPTSAFPSVGMLVQFGRGCSATLIGCQTVLTAAHCVCGLLPAERCKADPDVIDVPRYFLLQHAGVFAVASVDVDPKYVFPKDDLAVLHLAAPVTGVAPSAINTSGKPALGTKGTIAGFGMAKDAFYGLKRSGQVRLAPCGVKGVTQADHDCWLFDRPIGNPGTDSTICFGDSGGPLFTGTPAGLAISGVHSAVDTGDEADECKAPQHAIDADVFVRRDWIASASEDLGTAACGELPAAGSAQAPVLARVVAFTPQARSSRLGFNVAPGTTVLRVALNAYTNASSYDLYLNRGTPAGPTAFVCKASGSRSFRYCEVADPTPGAWNLLARLTSGFGGNAQETVTRYLPAPGPP